MMLPSWISVMSLEFNVPTLFANIVPSLWVSSARSHGGRAHVRIERVFRYRLVLVTQRSGRSTKTRINHRETKTRMGNSGAATRICCNDISGDYSGTGGHAEMMQWHM